MVILMSPQVICIPKTIEYILISCTLNVGRHPTGFAKLAWNVLKLTNMYAAKKKFEINGAIAFNSPIKMNLKCKSGNSDE